MTTTALNHQKHIPPRFRGLLAFTALVAWASPLASAQTADKKTDKTPDDSTIQLSPFEVVSSKDVGYAATSSLAGSRLNTPLKNIASAISVVTTEFMKDTGATDLQHILVYQTDTEVSGIGGNYYGGNADDGSYRARMLVNPQSASGGVNVDLDGRFEKRCMCGGKKKPPGITRTTGGRADEAFGLRGYDSVGGSI